MDFKFEVEKDIIYVFVAQTIKGNISNVLFLFNIDAYYNMNFISLAL